MSLSATLDVVARAYPSAAAITADDVTLDYAGFARQVAAIASAFRHCHGLAPGDRVALFMDNCGAYFPLMFGAWRAGLAVVPINNKLHAKEVAWIVHDARAKLCIVSERLATGLADVSPALPRTLVAGSADHRALIAYDGPALDDPAIPSAEAWLFYTSGTTGRPKGAILTHRNLLFACHAYYADIDPIDTRDCFLHAAPLSHGSGLYGLAHILKGSHQIIHDGFEPDAILEEFSRRRNLSMFAAPTMVTRLLTTTSAARDDAPGLKCIIYGGAPMYLADLERTLARFGPRLYQLYGQGESPMTISGVTKAMHADTAHPRFRDRLASAGIARTGVALKIVDADGRDVADGDIGEIVTRSDCVMAGYWNNPDANAKALRNGWLWTGDLGSRDADGFVTLKDRSKDLIISGGANIYPREIEEVLLRHAAVAECAVVGRPHADWGEEVVAIVVARTGHVLDEAELDRLCLDNIARFKRPKAYRIVEALPKNNYGKVLKTALRALIANQ